ncbi:hypothetical protein PsorP6_015459 [Peronosclerospora sorghi]|uniref:Uncharacterized protein n=1 Tax=Peronosclerospora sorghi TaxID=230839 RepID=A0ACC0WQ76_9STRA|nr:hypothetical protein PsorP6_015459 [Peronosclerospora sorghi]
MTLMVVMNHLWMAVSSRKLQTGTPTCINQGCSQAGYSVDDRGQKCEWSEGVTFARGEEFPETLSWKLQGKHPKSDNLVEEAQ